MNPPLPIDSIIAVVDYLDEHERSDFRETPAADRPSTSTGTSLSFAAGSAATAERSGSRGDAIRAPCSPAARAAKGRGATAACGFFGASGDRLRLTSFSPPVRFPLPTPSAALRPARETAPATPAASPPGSLDARGLDGLRLGGWGRRSLSRLDGARG